MAPTRFSSGPSLWSLSRYLRWDTRLAYTGMYPIPPICPHAQPSTPNAEGYLRNQPEISVRRSTAKSADRYIPVGVRCALFRRDCCAGHSAPHRPRPRKLALRTDPVAGFLSPADGGFVDLLMLKYTGTLLRPTPACRLSLPSRGRRRRSLL